MGDLALFLPFLALFGVIIYMQTRQRKKIQTRQSELQAALSIGAPIMLTCGLHGDVAGLDDKTVDVEIAPGVIATFARAAVLEVRGTESTFVDDEDDAVSDDVGLADDASDIGVTDVDKKTSSTKSRPAKPLASGDPSA